MSDAALACLVLAGGKGTRMHSRLPKQLHVVAGRPLLEWVLSATAEVGSARTAVVVPADPADADPMRALLPAGVAAAVQRAPRGTADAVLAGRDALAGFRGDVLVLYADTPLVDAGTLRALVDAHRAARAAVTILTIDRTAETGGDFGRVVRDAAGGVARVVEVRDATQAERELLEVNSGIYLFEADALWWALERVRADNDQGELYLTDTIGILHGAGRPVGAYRHPEAWVAHGVNTRADLAEAGRVLRARIARRHMLAGVTIVDPATTFIDPDVDIAADAVVEPFTVLRAGARIGAGASVGPHAVVDGAEVGEGATVGPFCYLRPGTVLAGGAKAGSFVEIKNSRIGAGAKVPHLSYIGDAEVGDRTNIGAGNITANYDGSRKQRTVIGDDVHTGSDNVFVAPVTIGGGAWTAAGSVITSDVPPEALGVARSKQTNIEGYARRRRTET